MKRDRGFRWGAQRRVGLTAVLCLAACQTTEPQPRLPSMEEIRSRPDPVLAELSPPADRARVVAKIRRIDLPLRAALDNAWTQVDETVVPALARGVWNANGLRIGLLPQERLSRFVGALPATVGERVSVLASVGHLTPVRKSPRLDRPVTIDLTIPPMAVRERKVAGGRLQLLARVLEPGVVGGPAFVELVPHHHKRGGAAPRIRRDGDRVRFEPRSALEKELDGQIFSDLALRVEGSPGHVLVIGLYWPWRRVGAEPGPRQAPPARPSVQAPPPLPSNVGRALFTADRPGVRGVQMLLVISLDAAPETGDQWQAGSQPHPQGGTSSIVRSPGAAR